MDLKEFVTKTLVQIVEGVQAAQTTVLTDALIDPSSNALINPSSTEREGSRMVAGKDYKAVRFVHNVEFDVAVTVSSGSEAKGGAGLFVAAIGMGAQAQKSTENIAISRVRFEVPIAFPTSRYLAWISLCLTNACATLCTDAQRGPGAPGKPSPGASREGRPFLSVLGRPSSSRGLWLLRAAL